MALTDVAVTPMVGVSGLVLFPVTEDTKTTLTTDDSNLIDLSECLVSKVYAPQVAEGEFYCSNKKQKSVKSNKGGNLTYVIPSIRPTLKEKVFGATKNGAGATVQSSSDTSPEFIAAHKIKLTDNIFILEKIGKVVFSVPTESTETEKETTTFQTAELVGSIVPLRYGGKGDFMFSVDSEDAGYADLANTWFSKGTTGIIEKII